MSYKIIQQELYVGTHEDKRKVKQLVSVPENWYISLNDDEPGVLYWPPVGTKSTAVKKMLEQSNSLPDVNTWQPQQGAIKRTNIPTLKMANAMIKTMKCMFY